MSPMNPLPPPPTTPEKAKRALIHTSRDPVVRFVAGLLLGYVLRAL